MGDRRVALWLELDDLFSQGVLRGAIGYARERGGWRLSGRGGEWMFSRDRRERPEAIIARPHTLKDARALRRQGVPVVDVSGGFPELGFHRVVNDDDLTGRLAVEHFREHGYRHFAFCGMGGTHWSRARREGFMAALAGGDGPPATVSEFVRPRAWWARATPGRALCAWLAALPRPCGLFAANDIAGLKITRAAAAAGRRVPEDLAVTGVDNEPLLCELSSPTLSSFPCAVERIGREAARLIDEILEGSAANGADPTPTLRTVAPGALVTRESSGDVGGDDPLVRAALRLWMERLPRGINVKETLRHLGVARRTLETRFAAALGRTPHEALSGMRLGRARDLLLSGWTAAAAGRACGFSGPQAFHQAFFARFGTTPGALRPTDPHRRAMGGTATFPSERKNDRMRAEGDGS